MVGIMLLGLTTWALGQESNRTTERSAPDLGRALNRWHKVCTEHQSLHVDLLVRELSSEGEWTAEEPCAAVFQFSSAPIQARLNVSQSGEERSWVLTQEGEWVFPEGERAPSNDPRAARREYLWIGPLPAFIFLGQDPEIVRDRFKARLVAQGENQVTLYLYPQTFIDEMNCSRIEARFEKNSMTPQEVHVVRRDGSHIFFLVRQMREDAADRPAARQQ